MTSPGLHRVIIEPAGVTAIEPAWRELATRHARSPFESPAWLVPWLRHYGSAWTPRLLTWWRGGELAGVAPISLRRRRIRGVPVRELCFWGDTETPLRGWVDLVARDDVAADVAGDFASWLAAREQDWDVFSYLHLDPDSPTLAALDARRSAWWQVDLSHVLHSIEYVIPLPEESGTWGGQLGPKAQREIRREMRLFARRFNGRFEEVTDPETMAALVDELEPLMASRWRDREAYFARDPRFRPFARDAIRETVSSGMGWALVARVPERIAACLVMLQIGRGAAAVLIGVADEHQYRPMSLGKCLFNRAIDMAVARGCRKFSFLTENGYKRTFWHALGQPVASGFLGRGAVGRAVAAYATVRRLPRHLGLSGGRGPQYRP